MKKIIFALFALNVSAAAFAADVKLEKGDITLRPITGELMDVPASMPNCPPNAVCDPAAIIKVHFVHSGCMNKLGPVTYDLKFNIQDAKYDLYLSALEIVNKKSETTACFRAVESIVTIYAGMGFISKDQVRLHNLTDAPAHIETF
jgi:hypothetical protein